MAMAAPTYYTADMVRALPDDGNRYEVVYGELLVTPSPRPWHQVLGIRLAVGLGTYLEANPGGLVLMSPADISWGRDDVLVQPDLFVVPREEVRTMEWVRIRSLLLAIEILSPSSQRADRFTKRRLYQERGVRNYWVVDGDERVVEVWTQDVEFPAIERNRLVWQPAEAREAFSLDLADLFRPV
jgi:Uma2 family endonuclease